MKNVFLKEVLFTPLDRIRFTSELVVQLKNNTQRHCAYPEILWSNREGLLRV